MPVTGTILLQNGTHMEIIHGFSDEEEVIVNGKKSKRYRKVFETPTGFVYKSGKPVTLAQDLEWLPEPWRTKALNWHKTGKKGDEQEQLTEIQKLQKRIAELEGQQMGKAELEKKVEAVPEKAEPAKTEAPKAMKPKKKHPLPRCKTCGKEFPHIQALGVHKKAGCQAEPIPERTEAAV